MPLRPAVQQQQQPQPQQRPPVPQVAFAQAPGLPAGVYAWRAHNCAGHFEMESVDAALPLFSDDSYLFLHARGDAWGKIISRDIWTWCGRSSTPDERGTVALSAVELDKKHLCSGAHIHNIFQGEEDRLFLALFPGGLLTLPTGGAASGFAHVTQWYQAPAAALPLLLRISLARQSAREVTQEIVPAALPSLTCSDAFLLLAGRGGGEVGVYDYIGKGAPAHLRDLAHAMMATCRQHLGACTAHCTCADLAARGPKRELWAHLGGNPSTLTLEEARLPTGQHGAAGVPGGPPRRPAEEAVLSLWDGSAGKWVTRAREPGTRPSVKDLPPRGATGAALVDVGSDAYLYLSGAASLDGDGTLSSRAAGDGLQRAAREFLAGSGGGGGAAPAVLHIVKANIVPHTFSDLFCDALGAPKAYAPPQGFKTFREQRQQQPSGPPVPVDVDAGWRSVLSRSCPPAPAATASPSSTPQRVTLSLKVQSVHDASITTLPREEEAAFYASDAFVITHTYTLVSAAARSSPVRSPAASASGSQPPLARSPPPRVQSEVFFWLGRHSSPLEQGLAAKTAVAEASTCGGHTTRVIQGCEPPAFVSIFSGLLVVHAGDRGVKGRLEEGYEDSAHLYQCKGSPSHRGSTRTIEVVAAAASLFSGDTFILVTKKRRVFFWVGSGSTDEERAVGSACAERLARAAAAAGSRGSKFSAPVVPPVVRLAEGSETPEFWAALGGRGEYARLEEAAAEGPFAVQQDPRLFHLSDVTGRLVLEEVENWGQQDLDARDVYILDAGQQVYAWRGAQCSQLEAEKLVEVAEAYVARAAERGAHTLGVPLVMLESGREPPCFKALFAGWDEEGTSVF